MKIKRNTIINEQGTLDITAAKNIFQTSNVFIKSLYKIMPLPTTELDDDDETLLTSTKQVKLKVFGEGTRAKSLEELHKKFDALKGKKKTYRDKLQMKGLKNRIKKKKEDKKATRLKKNLLKKQGSGPEFQPKCGTVPTKPPKPIYNSEGKMVFSKFDFTENSASGIPEKTFSSDPKAMLKKLEEQNEKIKSLEMHGETEKILSMKESAAWKKALDMAEGKKIKDNPTLLTKSIKKMKERKERTKKKWENIEKMKEKKSEMKQKKRTGNLNARKELKKKRKIKKSVRKGRVAVS